jgi:hypothetical protein
MGIRNRSSRRRGSNRMGVAFGTEGKGRWASILATGWVLFLLLGPTGAKAQDATTWIDLEVRILQEFMPEFPEFDGGHWTVSYRQVGPWAVRPGEGLGETVFGLLTGARRGAGPEMNEPRGSAYEVCMDGNADRWRTDYEAPLRVEPGTLTTTRDGDVLSLWYSVPIVEMFHPGHGHVPERSECHTMDPGMTELWLFTSDIEDAGAEMNEYGEFLIGRVHWDDLVAASRGTGDAITIDVDLQGPGNAFHVRGTIGPPPE